MIAGNNGQVLLNNGMRAQTVSSTSVVVSMANPSFQLGVENRADGTTEDIFLLRLNQTEMPIGWPA